MVEIFVKALRRFQMSKELLVCNNCGKSVPGIRTFYATVGTSWEAQHGKPEKESIDLCPDCVMKAFDWLVDNLLYEDAREWLDQFKRV
jgi:hypothetical protein